MSPTTADLLRACYRVREFQRAAGCAVPRPGDYTAVAVASALRPHSDGPPDVLTVRAGVGASVLPCGLPARDLARHLSDRRRDRDAREEPGSAGRTTPPVDGGYDGHPTRHDLGLIEPVPSHGVSVSVAAGAALAFRLRGEARIAVVAEHPSVLESGGWHEGFNLAAARGAPLVVVLSKNGPHGPGSATPRRAEAYGVRVDRISEPAFEDLVGRLRANFESARADAGARLIEVESRVTGPVAGLEDRLLGSGPSPDGTAVDRDQLDRWAGEATVEAVAAWTGLRPAGMGAA